MQPFSKDATDEPRGPVDASVVPRFAGIATFARLPRLDEVERADIAIVGIPFDSGVSYRPGARFGPAHVREASRLLRPYNPAQDVFPFGAQQVADAGDIAANPFDIAAAVAEIEAGARQLGEHADRLVAIGGDHTIALPLLRVAHAHHGPVAVLHFDAHLDTWDTYFGAPMTHGTPFRRASEEGLIDLTASMHVGIRGPLYSKDDLEDDARLGFAIVTSEFVEEHGVEAAVERIRARVGDAPLYISIDIDVLDPAHAPGTGTPEAGGLTSRELLRMLRALADLRIIGADVVEVAPAYDHAQLTAVAASHVVYELLSAMAPSVTHPDRQSPDPTQETPMTLPTPTDEAVRAAASAIVEAFAATDGPRYFSLFAPDATFVFHTEPERIEDRAAYEAMWEEWVGGGWSVNSCASSAAAVQAFPGGAVFTHSVSTSVSTADGPMSYRERETIVFRSDSAGLIAVHEHLSPQP